VFCWFKLTWEMVLGALASNCKVFWPYKIGGTATTADKEKKINKNG